MVSLRALLTDCRTKGQRRPRAKGDSCVYRLTRQGTEEPVAAIYRVRDLLTPLRTKK